MMTPIRSAPRPRLLARIALWLAFGTFAANAATAADNSPRAFDLPSDNAVKTLRMFSEQAGVPVLFGTDNASQVRTNAVKGILPPMAALTQMLADTGLVVAANEKTGALMVSRSPNAPRAVAAPGPARPLANATLAEEALVLSPFEVSESANDTYDATNTNSVTGTNLSLLKTPLDAKIFNRTMMDELDVVDVATMLATFGGMGPPLLGAGSETQSGMQEGDGVNYKGMNIRGLLSSNPRRDGFLRSDTSLMDSFDVESAEAIQGSNSLLFGSGDAGGVININSKRARLNQRSAKISTKKDSEGTVRFTTDINVGTGWLGLRVNAVREHERYYRPVLRVKQEGLQLAATARPWKWLTVSGEYRHFEREHFRSGNATVRAPTNLLLTTGERLDNQSARYLTGVGGSELLGNYLTLRNQESISGAYLQHHYFVEGKAITVEASVSADLHFQLRYGQDWRNNYQPIASNQVLFHPEATGNLATDAAGNRLRQWAMSTALDGRDNELGARGNKLTTTYHKNLGPWGDHRINAIVSAQKTWTTVKNNRFYELDSAGNIIQNLAQITNADSGQLAMPAVWVTPFAEKLFDRYSWPFKTMVHPNGKTYRLAPQAYEGAVPATTGNPLGLSGPVDSITGRSTVTGSRDETRERSQAASVFSEFWGGRINTMIGYRPETAETRSIDTGVKVGPIDYDSTTMGAVVDTPVKGIRAYASYATNARITYNENRDIYNQPLPIGRGVSREAGLKFALWDHRISGNIAYYLSEARNFTGTLSVGQQNDVDPNGINGRHGGSAYLYNVRSEGIDLALSLRPLRPWQVTVNYSQAAGRERSSVALPVFYNDEFNTTNVGGQLVVGVKNAITGTTSPLLVRSDPRNAASAQIPLSVAMLKDSTSAYFALLDSDSGSILNADALGLRTAGVGTNRTGLAVSSHQLGFVPPVPLVIVRQAGERTTGYPEHSFSVINRYQLGDGRLRGTMLGVATVFQRGVRGYMYTDAADAGRRRVFYYPDRIENRLFGSYGVKLGRNARANLQINVANLFDRQTVVALPRSTNGTIRYFAYRYSPRKFGVTTTLTF